MKLELFLDNGQVISNGSIVMEQNQIFKFNFNEYGLSYQVKFLADPNINGGKVDFNKNNEGQHEIIIINAQINEYSGNNQKLEVGFTGEKKLYFKYISQCHAPVGHFTLHYVWILE